VARFFGIFRKQPASRNHFARGLKKLLHSKYSNPYMTVRPVYGNVLDTIGNTPVVKLNKIVPAGSADVFVKLEYFNPTGSYKDRMALAMIEGAERSGKLRPGMRVVEFTGGSTGSSLAMVCAVKGYRFAPVSSDAFSQEKLKTMRAFGGELTIVPSDGGEITPPLFLKMRAEIERVSSEPDVFFTDQFNNEDALDGYAKIGEELLEQFDNKIDVYCGAVGTGGMLAGVSRVLKAGCGAKIVALEPEASAVMSGGAPGAHRVEGIATGRKVHHVEHGVYDEALAVSEKEAREIARRLAREEGILAGTSSGVNVLGAIQVARKIGSGGRVLTIAVDTGLKYLAGDLYS
jgi:cysteine synthase A